MMHPIEKYTVTSEESFGSYGDVSNLRAGPVVPSPTSRVRVSLPLTPRFKYCQLATAFPVPVMSRKPGLENRQDYSDGWGISGTEKSFKKHATNPFLPYETHLSAPTSDSRSVQFGTIQDQSRDLDGEPLRHRLQRRPKEGASWRIYGSEPQPRARKCLTIRTYSRGAHLPSLCKSSIITNFLIDFGQPPG
jgi:hypothetical protein